MKVIGTRGGSCVRVVRREEMKKALTSSAFFPWGD
jgi:hypothetical protein